MIKVNRNDKRSASLRSFAECSLKRKKEWNGLVYFKNEMV